MPDPIPAALAFLETRRSRPAKTLTGPVPDRAALKHLLTIAARSPDHGKLEPWRFLVLEKTALARLAETLPAKGTELGIDPDKIAKSLQEYTGATLAVAVIASPKPSEKIPPIEQTLSAGAVCMQLLNAALAAGWGANWLSGWATHDPDWRERNLGLMPHEWIAGVIHIGTETSVPPDRPRPDIDAITEWIEA
jgi:nitroreductase